MEIRDLDREISAGKIGRLYFFYGQEQFLLENKIKAIKKRIVEPDFEEFNFVKIEGKKITAREIENQVLSVPVMAERKMVVVSKSGIFGNAKAKDFAEVCELISSLPEYITLIFTEEEFDKKKEKNLDTVKKNGSVVKFDLLSPKQLEIWLEKMFEERGKTVLSKDISRMIEIVGQSMARLFNEFEKLVGFATDREKITAQDIESVVSKSLEARVFDLIDDIAEGRQKKVLEGLGLLRAAGENPATILSLVASRMGELLMVKQLLEDRVSADNIAGYFEPRKHPFVVKKLCEQSRRFGEDYLRKMTLKGARYAAEVRSGKLDKWIATEVYAAELIKK
ncbi:MAG: DNA polymerase III subunit delta [Clostridia bacterium]|nr:DNA polymerase III subunit delta [Clostridia bacterium]